MPTEIDTMPRPHPAPAPYPDAAELSQAAARAGYRTVLVETAGQQEAWLEVVSPIYAGDPRYVRPLDEDLNSIFDPARNRRYAHGQARRWLLVDRAGHGIGRIAAFGDNRALAHEGQRVGQMGFFECINEPAAAWALLSQAERWLAEEGYNVVEGPVNFGGRERWWGLWVEGVGRPSFGQNYHPDYYRTLIEGHGYLEYYRQLTYGRPIMQPLGDLVKAKAKRIQERGGYVFRHGDMRRADVYAEHFRHVYNEGWVDHEGFRPMSASEGRELLERMRPIVDERLLWFAFHGNEAVAFFVSLPDINQVIASFEGRMGLWQKVEFFVRMRHRPPTRMIGLAYGVVKAHQGRGLESALTVASAVHIQNPKNNPYREFEMNWIGDFNPPMIKQAEQVGGRVVKVHATYRHILDPSIPFERCPPIR